MRLFHWLFAREPEEPLLPLLKRTADDTGPGRWSSRMGWRYVSYCDADVGLYFLIEPMIEGADTVYIPTAAKWAAARRPMLGRGGSRSSCDSSQSSGIASWRGRKRRPVLACLTRITACRFCLGAFNRPRGGSFSNNAGCLIRIRRFRSRRCANCGLPRSRNSRPRRAGGLHSMNQRPRISVRCLRRCRFRR